MPQTEAQKQAKKLYYQQNRERIAAYRKQYQKKYRERDRAKRAEDKKRWYQENKTRLLEKECALKLEKRYGLTPAGREAIFEAQGGACAACGGTDPRGGRWVIDHCHETGLVRGILCLKCNTALGHADDSPDLLLDLLNYIGKFS